MAWDPVNYSLRLHKNIQRKMICEALGRLAPTLDLRRYQYIGFGSPFFSDFVLMHRAHAFEKMICVEDNAVSARRCQFNKPFSCVEVVECAFDRAIDEANWSKRSVVWADYTTMLDVDRLGEIARILLHAQSGSVLLATFNAHPWTPQGTPAEQLPGHRVKMLREAFPGREFDDIDGGDLANWGLSGVFYGLLCDHIASTINSINEARAGAPRRFVQFLHFRYKDPARMLTIGGLIVDEDGPLTDWMKLFAGLSFIRGGVDAYELTPEVLTTKEIRRLTQRLPRGRVRDLEWITRDKINKFKEYYRYYPIFAESEL